MDAPPPDVKVPTIVESTGDTDWQRVHLYNQERMLNGQEEISDLLKGLLETQRNMAEFAQKLHVNLETLDATLMESSRVMKGFMSNLVKLPIVIVILGLSSWAFYFEKLSEKGWMIIMFVATFPYLGDGIIAIAKILRGQAVNGEKK